jgi:purine-binding chemotaxis protein CheW
MSQQNPGRPSLSMVRCKVGGDTFLLDLCHVSGFQRAERLRVAGRTGPHLFELVGPAGTVPVFGLASLLGRSQPPVQPRQHVVLVTTAAGLWGLLADQVSQALKVEAEACRPLPPLCHAWPAIPADQVILHGTAPQLLLLPERLHPDGQHPPRSTSLPAPIEQRRPGKTVEGQMLVFAGSPAWAGERRLLFGLNLALLEEVIDLPTLVPVPRVPEYVLGLVVWRDQVVPVVDLGCRLGLPPTRLRRNVRLLVVNTGSDADVVCFPVLPGIQVLSLPVPHLPCTRPLPVDLSLAHGAVELKRETLVVPNLKKILAVPATGTEILR